VFEIKDIKLKLWVRIEEPNWLESKEVKDDLILVKELYRGGLGQTGNGGTGKLVPVTVTGTGTGTGTGS